MAIVEDVTLDSSKGTEEGKGKVEAGADQGNDKDKNFAELRKKLAEREEEIERLKKGGQPKEEQPAIPEAEQIAFKRDLKDVSIRFSGKHKLAPEKLKELTSKITFKGDEVQSEIEAKLKDAYEALPEVRAEREKKLRDEGRREAMREFQDEEMDIGGGGDADLGGGEAGDNTRFNSKEKSFLDSMGVSQEDRKKINKQGDANQWQPGPQPTRKFFARGG